MKFLFSKFLLFLFVLGFSHSFSQIKNTNERPKLVVGIVVDQMRWDYLYKYYDRYGEGGFKRMLSEGFTAENTLIPYVPTYTAIGHATVYSGSVPAIHGIAGNDFYVRETQNRMYCVQDEEVKGVGLNPEHKAGKMSPRNLLTTTITDELKLATDFKSKVIGISLKDRGAVLPAGHFGDAAYWMVDGNWVTSSFYMNELPTYIKAFNQKDFTQKYIDGGWQPLYDLDSYMNHLKDDNPYEEPYVKNQKVTFPIELKTAAQEVGRDIIKTTPFGNTLSLMLAKEIMEKENLGLNPANVPDFLAISLSSTDYVGHQFAINSAKIEDTYLRLDQDLEDFFKFLDQKIGHKNYTVFLTADHGAASNPQFIMDEGGNAGYFPRNDMMNQVNDLLEKEFGHPKIIYAISNNQVFLNNKLMAEKQLNREKIKTLVIDFFKAQKGISFVADMEKVSMSSIPDRIKQMIINGYNYKRSGDIQLIMEPQWFNAYGSGTGTTHGAWNPYDSHIPLVFMGWGVRPGKTNRTTYMTDIAPTVSAMLHIQPPNGNIGDVIIELTD